MSQAEVEVDPVRRRAGLLSWLAKLYVSIKAAIEGDSASEDVLQLQDKLNTRYAAYLESHELALATYPDREESLIASHLRNEERHQRLLGEVQAYLQDGTKPDDVESLHAASLFSRRSSAKHSVAKSCPVIRDAASRVSQVRSVTTLSETRVQAALAKRRYEQQQAEQRAAQRKIEFDREVARQHRELDERQREAEIRQRQQQEEAEARERLLQDEAAARERHRKEEAAARERQLQLETERQMRELEQRQRVLREEAELRQRELDNALKLKKQKDEMENLQAELRLREREEVRTELGSDYDSDSDRVDVTKPDSNAPKYGQQLESEQDAELQKILQVITDKQALSGPAPRDSVRDWLNDSDGKSLAPTDHRKPQIGYAPQQANVWPSKSAPTTDVCENMRSAYVPPTNSHDVPRRDAYYDRPMHDEKHSLSKPSQRVLQESASQPQTTPMSDAALFSRALMEQRLPTPKQLEFDGNPKTFKAFLASFKTNIESKLTANNDADSALKLTYLLQHCTGKAKDLIDDCVMLEPTDGFHTAMERLHECYGKSHVIARSYIESVTKGPAIKLNDISALEQLKNDMVKCQSVLSRLEFGSDLDSSGTLSLIVKRLPDAFRFKWLRRASKILDGGRSTKFCDLVTFVKEESNIYNSSFGQEYADEKTGASKSASDSPRKDSKPKQPKAKVTTLATTGASAGSTAGPAPSDSSIASQKPKTQCDNCDIAGHFISRCFKFKKLSRDDKLEVIKKKNLCYCCLRSGHGTKDCGKRCVKCDKKHHVLIHEDASQPASKNDQSKPQKSSTATETATLSTSAAMDDAAFGALPVRVRFNNKEKLVVALIDTGSNTTLVRRSLVDELGITGSDASPVAVHTVKGPVLQSDQIICKLELLSDDRSSSVLIDKAMTVPAIPVRAVVDGKAFKEWPHLRDLELPYIPRIKIDIIIGTDCPEMHQSLEDRYAGRKAPLARRTPLGWIVLGPSEKPNSLNSLATSVIDPLTEQLRQISLLDFQDTNVSEPAMSVDDRRALKKMEETAKVVDGKYQVGIPWKDDPDEALQNNRSMAESRLRMLKKKFATNPQLAEDYTKTVEAYIADNQAKLVEEDVSKQQSQWFLPHHAVFKKSNPSKCRVVFDCAAQFNGVSLNDAILQGPNFLNNLAGVLIRFRKEPVAVIGDIKLMFHQCFVQPDDTRFLRFLWWPGGDTSVPAKVYAMQVHLFGGKSSPSVVNYCMRKTADDHELKYSELAINTLRRSFYMDDMIRSVKCIEDATNLIPEMEKLLQEGGFDLGKFMSTSREVIESVPEEKRAKSLQNLDLNDCSLPQESALGLKWNVEGDFFTYTVDLQDKPMTRRGVLSTTASLYDPLGLVAPVLLVPKMIQQELCKLNLEWDDALPSSSANEFINWKANTSALSKLQIPRCFQSGPSDGCKLELHFFSDASEFAYGSAVYLKVVSDTEVRVNLVLGKSRVAPLKVVSIPRLELTAATLSAKISRFIMEELDVADVAVFFWTDSMTVLRYLRNVSTRFKTFVAHRVQQIQDITDINSWNYVPTDKNPADLASRGMSPEDESKMNLWLSGPAFLKEQAAYNGLFEEPADDAALETRVCGVANSSDVLEDLLHHYSSYYRLKRAVSWIFKFWEYLQQKTVKPGLSLAEMNTAEEGLLCTVQRKVFSAEITALRHGKPVSASSSIRQFSPILHGNLLCVGWKASKH